MQLGKMTLPTSLQKTIDSQQKENNITLLPKIEEITIYDDTAGKIVMTVGMAGTNDDDVNGAGRAAGDVAQVAHWLIRTATFVGFVMMSNTAERFCDWATTAAMSSSEASASIV